MPGPARARAWDVARAVDQRQARRPGDARPCLDRPVVPLVSARRRGGFAVCSPSAATRRRGAGSVVRRSLRQCGARRDGLEPRARRLSAADLSSNRRLASCGAVSGRAYLLLAAAQSTITGTISTFLSVLSTFAISSIPALDFVQLFASATPSPPALLSRNLSSLPLIVTHPLGLVVLS